MVGNYINASVFILNSTIYQIECSGTNFYCISDPDIVKFLIS